MSNLTELKPAAKRFVADWSSIRTHKVPAWYDDCKLGIFIHWGAYSVPAYANPVCELGEVPIDEGWFSNNPYAEWYLNSLRIGHGSGYDYHVKTYGKDFPYENFANMWQAENWNPAAWVDLFKKSGARYIVPVTKHHDGLCLWNSQYTEYNTVNLGPKRDIIMELSEAVRAADLKFGVYYSGILDWRYTTTAIHDEHDIQYPPNITNAYADYAFNQAMELVDLYKPSVFWNDINWPKKGMQDLPTFFSHYYNTVPEGVVNDRWGGTWQDYGTREYKYGSAMTLDQKWEMCRGLGLSFGYNHIETDAHFIQPNKLISLLLLSVSHNGNLLINVGPKADGTIQKEQEERLLYLGEWLKQNGEAIYGTRPWERQMEKLAGDVTVYFTKKPASDGQNQTVYVILDGLKEGNSSILVPGLGEVAMHMHTISAVKAFFTSEGPDLEIRINDVGHHSPALVFAFNDNSK